MKRLWLRLISLLVVSGLCGCSSDPPAYVSFSPDRLWRVEVRQGFYRMSFTPRIRVELHGPTGTTVLDQTLTESSLCFAHAAWAPDRGILTVLAENAYGLSIRVALRYRDGAEVDFESEKSLIRESIRDSYKFAELFPQGWEPDPLEWATSLDAQHQFWERRYPVTPPDQDRVRP